MHNLELTEKLTAMRARQTGLPIGEGYCPLLGHLVEKGATKVRAVDPGYGLTCFPESRNGLLLSGLFERYRSHLILENVLTMQVWDGSQDFVWSHLMVRQSQPVPSIATTLK